MTSSEVAASSEAPPPAPRVIAEGHLHPGMLFLRLLDGLRQAIVPVAFAVIAQQLWLLVAVGMYFVLAMGMALARYLTFEYRLTDDELITTEGILHRQERRIRVSRIQDLSFESTIVRRLCGLVVVSVETASSQGAEAVLDSLSRARAEQLREALYRARAERAQAAAAGDGSGVAADPEAAAAAALAAARAPEHVLFRASGTDLLLLGLTNNRVGVILATAFAAWELSAEFGVSEKLGGAFGQLAARLGQVHFGLLIGLLVAVVFMALLAGWLVAVGTSFLMFHDFHLTVREDVFQRRYGLLTTRAASLPRRKIQRVLIEQSWLRRLLGFGVLRADSAGSGMDPKEETRGARDVVIPMAEMARVEPLVPTLLPGLVPWTVRWSQVSPRVVMRIFLKGCVLAAAVGGGLAASVGWWALLSLLVLPLGWVVGVLSYQNLAYSELDGYLALRWGVIGRYRAFVPLRKVQGVVVRASPIDRLLGLAALTLYVAGGSPSTMANLPAGEARALQERLAREAAASRFVW
ncbi:MAG: PH domain-containing protein [Planctomycetota bacterium]